MLESEGVVIRICQPKPYTTQIPPLTFPFSLSPFTYSFKIPAFWISNENSSLFIFAYSSTRFFSQLCSINKTHHPYLVDYAQPLQSYWILDVWHLNWLHHSLTFYERFPMSTTDRYGFKIVLPRTGADEFWQVIHDNFAGHDEQTWKHLAMLALRENAGWPLEAIGQVFGHSKGTVSKNLSHLKQQLREHFKL